jgi:hypothetical protein
MSVDMNGYEGVVFFTTPGTITSGAVTSMKVQESADDSTWADLEGTGQTIADDDDNQVFAVEIYRPKKRYLRVVVDRATQNAVVGEIYAIRYGLRSGPADNNVADTITSEIHISPDAGTA